MTINNPALRQEPRYEPAAVIPVKSGDSLLYWLESNGRMIPRYSQEEDEVDVDEADEEIAELMDVDDKDFDDDDDALEDLDD